MVWVLHISKGKLMMRDYPYESRAKYLWQMITNVQEKIQEQPELQDFTKLKNRHVDSSIQC